MIGLCVVSVSLQANASLKTAFSEGIKTSIEVVKYEKSQALKPIPQGYCVSITGKDTGLDEWEEVKLESLALFLAFSPALLASEKDGDHTKRILCLSITPEKKEAIAALKKIGKQYPKIDEYLTKIEILSSHTMYRVIPGVGKYFKDRNDEVDALKQKMQIDKPLSNRVVFLHKKKKPKILFDSGSTRVVSSGLKNILYVEHTVYSKRGE